MNLKIGQIVGFKIDKNDERDYVDWFRYMVKNNYIGQVIEHPHTGSVRCKILNCDSKLLQMKNGDEVFTGIETVYSLPFYQEV